MIRKPSPFICPSIHLSVYPLSVYSTDIYWRVNDHEKEKMFLKCQNPNREDNINIYTFYKRHSKIITVWIGVGVRDGWWYVAREGLNVIGTPNFKPKRFEHMEIGRWHREDCCILVRVNSMSKILSEETVGYDSTNQGLFTLLGAKNLLRGVIRDNLHLLLSQKKISPVSPRCLGALALSSPCLLCLSPS